MHGFVHNEIATPNSTSLYFVRQSHELLFAWVNLPQNILQRLDAGEIIIGDGGYAFALEKRGYVKAGPWTPEAAAEHPEAGSLPLSTDDGPEPHGTLGTPIKRSPKFQQTQTNKLAVVGECLT